MESSYLAQAIAQCERAINTEVNTDRWQAAFKNLGNLLQGRAEFDRAIVWHSLALEDEPNVAEVYSQLGELYLLENSLQEALNSFTKALEYIPNSARIYSAMAQINSQLGRKTAEMECWYKATQINPDLVTPQGYLKLARALLKGGKTSKAIACYQKAAFAGDGIDNAVLELAEIYHRQGKLDEAQAVYEKVLQRDPTAAMVLHKLGTIYLERGAHEEAIDCFRQTIKHAPDFQWAYRDLVKTFLAIQKWDEAISTCYAILNLVEEYPWVYSQLGNALRQKGKLSEASVNFQKTCAYRGWSECVERNYYFSFDNFSHRIAFWAEHLEPLREKAINALEIGSYQGMSGCWLLDRILLHEESKLTCIDGQFNAKFKENIVKSGAEAKVNLLKGNTHELMANCLPESFDLINLQDRCKLTEHTETNTRLAWRLASSGAYIIFSSFGWRNARDERQNPQLGIERFLGSVKQQWELVNVSPPSFQLIIRKL